MTKHVMLLAMFAAAGAFAQSLDLSSLDKLASKAKEANTVSLDADQIRAAVNLMGSAGDSGADARHMKDVLGGIKSIQVRNFEFAEKGQYSPADADAIRAQIAQLPGWTKIVESKQAGEQDEVYLLTQAEKLAGLAVIAAEPKELSVVFINGSVNLSDLGKLHAVLKFMPEIPAAKKAPGAENDKPKK